MTGRAGYIASCACGQVAFEAIQESPRHKSGFALRFPRIVRLRTDKTPADVNTLEDVRRMYAQYRSVYGG